MIQKKEYPAPPVDTAEVLRYARTPSPDPATEALLRECLEEAMPLLQYKVCYRILPLNQLAFHSEILQRHLQDCKNAVLFAATLGLAFDRLLAKYSALSPAKAVLLQALGAERIEALCDTFCKEFHGTGRYSPGYGDFDLACQTQIFALLDCPRQIGLSLQSSLVMTPTKSVTAIFGIKE